MLLRVVAAAVGLLPWRALAPLGALVGWIAGDVLRVRRRHVEGAMRAAGLDRARQGARAMYASLGASLLELLWLAARGDEALAYVTIDEESAGRWRRARADGRGVVVAASHTGNWDLAACAIARQADLLVVTKRLRVRVLDRFWQATRARFGVLLTDGPGTLARARSALRRGAAVAMMIDQVPALRRQGVEAEFLGRPALADRAPAALAAASGVPLVVAVAARGARGRHVLYVLEVLQPPRRPTARWIDETTVAATGALDRFVRANPSQWLWLHRRWKAVDPGPCETKLRAWPTTPSSSPAAPSTAG